VTVGRTLGEAIGASGKDVEAQKTGMRASFSFSRWLAATSCVSVALLSSMLCYLLANRVIICGPKPELLTCPFTGDIESKPVEHHVVAFAGNAALCVATSVFAATANADNSNLGSIRWAVWRPPRQTVFHDPVRERGVS
jgi:hypothetical protein